MKKKKKKLGLYPIQKAGSSGNNKKFEKKIIFRELQVFLSERKLHPKVTLKLIFEKKPEK